jgi:GT2 family glycosyltransferase
MEAQFLFSILIVNWNGLKHLPECLGSLMKQDFRNFEIILVDNASSDGSVEFVRTNYPDVRIVETASNLGFAGGNNAGIPHCRGRFVFFLNNDTRTESGALSALAEAVAAHERTRVFACFLLRYDDPTQVDSAGDTLYSFGSTFSYARYPASLFKDPREVTCACAGAAVYARSLLDEIGFFDEEFFLIFEDTDLSFRARHHGETILFLPQVRILHKGSATLGKGYSPTALYYGSRNYPLLFIKNFPFLTLCKALPGMVFINTLRLIATARQGKAGILLRSWRDASTLVPLMLKRRREILSRSHLNRSQFENLLRSHFLQEWIGAKRPGYRYPL